MKKIIAISAAAVCLIGGIFAISAVSAHKSLDKITKGESAIYSDEDFDAVTDLLKENMNGLFMDVKSCSYLGDSKSSEEFYKREAMMTHFKNTREIAAYDDIECMTYQIQGRYSVNPRLLYAVMTTEGISEIFKTKEYTCLCARINNENWDFVSLFGNDEDYHYSFAYKLNSCDSKKYDSRDITFAIDDLANEVLENEEYKNYCVVYVKYAGDEFASKEVLNELNNESGKNYTDCMKIYADVYSSENKTILTDTEWYIARKGDKNWEIIKYDTSADNNK